MKEDDKIKVEEATKKVVTKAKSSFQQALAEIFLNHPDKAHAQHGIPTWSELSARRKVGFIVSWIVLALSLTLVILVLNFPTVFGYSSSDILVGVESSHAHYFPITFLRMVFYTVFIYASVRILVWLLNVCFVHASKKAITIVRLIASTVEYLSTLALIFLILGIWGVDTSTILASAGIIALIIGLGAQSLIADVIGGLAIVFESQFDVGDVIVVDGFRGTVQEIGLTATRLVDAAGNCKIIKNSAISTIINLSHDYSVAVVDLPVDYDEDLAKIRSLLETNLPLIGKKIPELQGPLTYLGVQEFQDSGILLRVIGKVDENDKFGVTRRLNEEIYVLFKANNIRIPFNQITVSTRQDAPTKGASPAPEKNDSSAH